LRVAHSSCAKSRATLPGTGTGAVTLDGHAWAEIVGCNFTDNVAALGGALSFLDHVLARVHSSTFSLNVASSRGAAVVATGHASVGVLDSHLARNSASGGAAVSAEGKSILAISDSSLSYNQALDRGAGVLASDESTVAVVASRLVGNQAHFGGGVAVTGQASMWLERTSLTGNVALACGGAVSTESTLPLSLVGVVSFSENRAQVGASGGAVCATLTKPGTKECSALLGEYPYMILPARDTIGFSQILFERNDAKFGGGALMANCIKPGGKTLAMSDEIIVLAAAKSKKADVNVGVFKFRGNTAGYGPNVGTIAEQLEFDARAPLVAAYKPGGGIASVLRIRDSFKQTVALHPPHPSPKRGLLFQTRADSHPCHAEQDHSFVGLASPQGLIHPRFPR